jgi:cysteine desulfurase / selenocysteine lyase
MKTSTEPLKGFDIAKIRADFPILERMVHGKKLVYFDNGATSQKPRQVIDAITNYYTHLNSNIHRGVHTLSQEATDAYENARQIVANHINAKHTHEIIFTRGTTESINLVTSSFGKKFIQKGDEIIITAMEHHSNIVPWHMLCEEKEAVLKVIPFDDHGALDLEAFEKLMSPRTKLVSMVHVSNSLGVINPVEDVIRIAHKNGVKVLLDGAQAIPHMKVDVTALDVDFYCFSGHKAFGPTGVGILYGKESILNEMPPYQGGGEMIKTVTLQKTVYNDLPFKFEAGTPNIEGGIVLGEALNYINSIGLDNIRDYERSLLDYATGKLLEIPGIKIFGTTPYKAAVISFLAGDIHPYDMGMILDKLGIAVRTGHHCTQPIMDRFCIPGTARASMCFYNTKEEIDVLIDGVKKVIQMMG